MGKIITIEGGDGTGKATQAKLLFDYLNEKDGIRVKSMSFPNYDSRIGKIIKESYLGGEFGDPTEIPPMVAGCLYAIDRFNVGEEISRWLKDEKFIWVFDRYYESNPAYQCAKDFENREKILKNLKLLENGFLKIPRSDLVIYLSLSSERASEAMEERMLDGHEKNKDYQQRVKEIYDWLAEREKWEIVDCIDKSGERYSINEVRQRVIEIVEPWLARELKC